MNSPRQPFQLRIDLSLDEDFDYDDPEHITAALNEHIDIAQGAINFFLSDDRAEVCEDSATFTDVTREGYNWRAYWSFEWSVYSGCKDFCGGDEVEGSTIIKVSEEDQAIFLSHAYYPDRPTTFEEF